MRGIEKYCIKSSICGSVDLNTGIGSTIVRGSIKSQKKEFRSQREREKMTFDTAL